MRRPLGWLFGLVVVSGAGFYVATVPRGLPQAELAALQQGDASRGETWFWAGGCADCHAAAKAKGEDRLRLGGGQVLKTEFGDFVVPNISSDRTDGIGGWTESQFANAVLRGVSPEGRHFYPAFPYTSFTRMKLEDVADLRAFFGTLPPVSGQQAEHSLRFPFNIRRGIGLWKLAFLSSAPVVRIDASDPLSARGQYLVEGPGHCGECHTPRNFAGASDHARWLAGAKAAEGTGRVPDITSGGDVGEWAASDIAYYLETGFTPEFDSVGGAMAEVQQNMAMLTGGDRDAIAAYLKAIPALPPEKVPAAPRG